MRMILSAILALVLCGPAFATPAQDVFRDMILAGDVAGVDNTLTQAGLQDAQPGTDPELQRSLFTVFFVTDPKIESFTATWLEKQPTSPFAMVARAKYLHAMANANRGGDWPRETYHTAIETMQALDTQALALFRAASTADPGLLAASDGLLVLTQSVSPEAMLAQELFRIMALRPNRGSMMRAMFKLAPQWGGTADQVHLVCDRYAPMVTSIKDYSPEVCVVDAVYYGRFTDGPMRGAASLALQKLTNPVLDYARVLDAIDGKASALQRLAVLGKLQAERPLTAKEALALDNANIALTHVIPDPPNDTPTYRKALPAGIASLGQVADRDPLNPEAVLEYILQLQENFALNGVNFDRADADQRLHRLLVAIPHSWRGWMRLAQLQYGDKPGALQKAGAYYQNAIFYSNYSLTALDDAISVMAAMSEIYARRKSDDGKLTLTPEDLAEVDRLGKCPVVGLARVMEAVCSGEGIGHEDCFSMNSGFMLKRNLADVQTRGACTAEATAALDNLIKGPAPADF